MHEHKNFFWIEQLPVIGTWPLHVSSFLLVAIVLMVTTLIARMLLVKEMQRAGGALVPDSTWTYRNFFEILAEGLFKIVEVVLGHHQATVFYPLIASLFLIIFSSNLLGVIPGFSPPMDNYNTTLSLGLFVFIYYNYVGFKEHGIAYLKHFFGPVWWLGPLFLVIEVVSNIFRPISLGLRLQGNIMGDHIVLHVFSGLTPFVIPVIFYGLGLFVAFMQAFVFCLMTMVYISLSTSHDH
jgi:F-type H+-transporting ATPase subunit a